MASVTGSLPANDKSADDSAVGAPPQCESVWSAHLPSTPIKSAPPSPSTPATRGDRELSVLVLVQDCADLDDSIAYLSAQGLKVLETRSIEEAASQCSRLEPAVILIAAELPDRQVSEFVRSQKFRSPEPGLMILSDTTDTVERVLVLELGVDDLISPSSSPREILARVHRLLRRYSHQNVRAPTRPAGNGVNTEGPWLLIERTRTLRSPSGESCTLPKHSVELLKRFILHAENGLGASIPVDAENPSIRTAVYKLRKHLLEANIQDDLVRNVRGKNYVLCKQIRLVASGGD